MKAKLSAAFFLLLIFVRCARAGECFTSGKTVVVLAGLPGDVETEKRYDDHLKTLLDLLSRDDARPKRLFVFADEPSRVALPAGLPGEVKANSRENFLALTHALRASKESLVVFAWGHGGLQKATPVFHVRGPRLTADDFKKLAQAHGGDSRWMLFFRGSGSFATAVRAATREIVSTENETPFSSDPVGFELLLQILRHQPGISFPGLAAQLGETTAEWYEEKHLARTEEPTLWNGEDPPQLLAVLKTPTGFWGRKAPAWLAKIKQDDEKPAADAKPKEEVNSAAWKEVKLVEPSKVPDAAAVVLSRKISYVLGDAVALSQEHEEFIQILTEAGKHHGDFDVSYSPPEQTITFLDLEVRKPDGAVERVDPGAIHEAVQPTMPGYETTKRKIFSLPHVTPGAVLHVRYRTEWKHFPLPHVFLEVPLADALPMIELRIEVRVPSQSALHFAVRAGEARNPAIAQTNFGSVYTWRFADIPARLDELLSPPERVPELLVSTFPDWENFASWYGRLIREADKITPEIEAKARELTRDGKTEREKIVALYNFVTGLRYVAVPLGVNSHRPHAAANVLANGFGDCKDKANLFNTLLRSIGLEAALVLVPRFSQAHDALPGFAFNHAISRVRLGKEILWADTTDDTCRFGLLPPGDAGRRVLVVDGKTNALTTLPAPAADQHTLALTSTIQVTRGTAPFPCELIATTSGYCDYALRAAASSVEHLRTTRPALAQICQQATGLFAMTAQEHSRVGALDEPFTWSASGRWSGLASALPGGERVLLRAPFWIPGEWNSAPHPRHSPLFLNQGYPLKFSQRVIFKLADESKKIELPVQSRNAAGPLRWMVEWSQPDGSTLLAHAEIELVTGELSDADTLAFQKQVAELWTVLGSPAALGK